MHIIEIHTPETSWVAAVFQDRKAANAYLLELNEKIKSMARTVTIALDQYPIYIVKNPNDDSANKGNFGYLNHDQLISQLESTPLSNDKNAVHFTYYPLEADYQQLSTDCNQMHWMRHTDVTNAELNESEFPTPFKLHVEKLGENYDIESLDNIYAKQISTLTHIQKTELATLGYEDLFCNMLYDFECGKLTDAGVSQLIPMVDKMESLLNQRLWRHRAAANDAELRHLLRTNPSTITTQAQNAIAAYLCHAQANPDEADDCHRQIASICITAINADSCNAADHWQKGLEIVKASIQKSPITGNWNHYLNLIFCDFDNSHAKSSAHRTIKNKQHHEQTAFLNNTKTLVNSIEFSIPLAMAFLQLKKHLEWLKQPEPTEIDAELAYWTEHSLATNAPASSRFELLEIASFYHNEGLRLEKIHLIEKAAHYYQRIANAISDNGLEVYYQAKCWQDIAEIYRNHQEQAQANTASARALAIYQTNEATIKANFSAYLSYAKFMEQQLVESETRDEETFARLQQMAIELEELGEGHYSTPILLSLRLALLNNDEDLAIYHLTRSLILHELCISDDIDALITVHSNTSFKKLYRFLLETKQFMSEVNDNYYLHTELKWDQLNRMTRNQTQDYWQQRQASIRAREPINWGQ